MRRKSLIILLALPFLLFLSRGYAGALEDRAMFQALFDAWTQAFNQKKYPEVCKLFAKSITADYQGAARKDYAGMCDGFRKIFEEDDAVYHNEFRIHEIYRSNDVAAVRITWYLTVHKNGSHFASIQEEGLDVLRKQSNGRWQIVNFIAYPVSPNK
jgi:ketosteroid isomerase-like protein